ncbi:M28 family peptidase [Rosettibacter firmus]|uniref:M28 family peptidase n=1 Tax=Rosettibacter firmus TaxID=3111522 RepID=UPI00336BEF79
MDELLLELQRYQKRNSRKEKNDFIDYLKQKFNKLGFEFNVVKTKLINSVHFETVSDDNPDIILMAHYDTGTILPCWYEWLIRLTGHTRSILTALIVLLVFKLVSLTYNEIIINIFTITVGLSFFIPALFIKNQHTMNDNTSGVMALLLLAEKIAVDDSLKKRVKIVFTDNEEKILIGSYQLRKIWEKNGLNYKNAKIISVDCIGRGEHVIISYNFVNSIAKELIKVFEKNKIRAKCINMCLVPLSDAYNFWTTGAVNINMMYKTIIPGGYYIKNIHSYRDKEISKDNIKLIVESLIEYIKTYTTTQYS